MLQWPEWLQTTEATKPMVKAIITTESISAEIAVESCFHEGQVGTQVLKTFSWKKFSLHSKMLAVPTYIPVHSIKLKLIGAKPHTSKSSGDFVFLSVCPWYVLVLLIIRKASPRLVLQAPSYISSGKGCMIAIHQVSLNQQSHNLHTGVFDITGDSVAEWLSRGRGLE